MKMLKIKKRKRQNFPHQAEEFLRFPKKSELVLEKNSEQKGRFSVDFFD